MTKMVITTQIESFNGVNYIAVADLVSIGIARYNGDRTVTVFGITEDQVKQT